MENNKLNLNDQSEFNLAVDKAYETNRLHIPLEDKGITRYINGYEPFNWK